MVPELEERIISDLVIVVEEGLYWLKKLEYISHLFWHHSRESLYLPYLDTFLTPMWQ